MSYVLTVAHSKRRQNGQSSFYTKQLCLGARVLQAVFEVTLKTPERLSLHQLITTDNTTAVIISPHTTRYTQVTFTFSFAFNPSVAFTVALLSACDPVSGQYKLCEKK